MRLQNFLIGLMIFSVFISLTVGYMFSAYDAMGVDIPDNDSAVITGFQTIAEQSNDDLLTASNNIRKKSPGGDEVSEGDTDETREDNLLNSGYKVISLIPRSYDTAKNLLFSGVAEYIGIDQIFLNLIMASIVIIISLILISSVLRNKL